MEKSVHLECPSCGAHIGNGIPEYMAAAICYCGTVIPVLRDRDAIGLLEEELELA